MSINDYFDSCDAVAHDALVKAKAISVCRFHTDVTIRLGDEDAERRAYALVTNVMKRDGTIAFMREDVTAAVKHALDDAADECPLCGSYD